MPLVYNPKMYTGLRLGQIFTEETLVFVSVSITVVHSVVLFFNTAYRGRAPRMPSRALNMRHSLYRNYSGMNLFSQKFEKPLHAQYCRSGGFCEIL
jgi:hypothetical protein